VHLQTNRSSRQLIRRIARLRTELVDLAYALDIKGRHDAADVTLTVSARLAETCTAAVGAAGRPAGRLSDKARSVR